MRSVADDLRSETRHHAAHLTPAQRIELALRLGDEDVAAMCAARGMRAEEARRLIARSRGLGRPPSAVLSGADG